MSTFSRYLIDLPARLLEPLRVPLLLIARLWVSWQFLKSGWLKITSWENTLFLFSEEYHVPVLPPVLAAIVGRVRAAGTEVTVLDPDGGTLVPSAPLPLDDPADVIAAGDLQGDGIDEIVARWQEIDDQEDNWDFEWLPLVETDDLAVVTARTQYLDPPLTYRNLFIIRFADDDRCYDFTEWYIEEDGG